MNAEKQGTDTAPPDRETHPAEKKQNEPRTKKMENEIVEVIKERSVSDQFPFQSERRNNQRIIRVIVGRLGEYVDKPCFTNQGIFVNQ